MKNAQGNQYEIVDFMLQRFSKWSGIQFGQPIERKIRPAPLSPSQVPLPPLPYKIEQTYGSHLLNFQKNLDKNIYDLESKYSKYLSIEEFRDEVMAEMSQVSKHNHEIQNGLLRHRLSRTSRAPHSRSMTINKSSLAHQDSNKTDHWSIVNSSDGNIRDLSNTRSSDRSSKK
uniref:Uncharacterized protein n=1 Tax=Ciona savignyi TaxID=51511 RepID=H2ZNI8_CIOSA